MVWELKDVKVHAIVVMTGSRAPKAETPKALEPQKP